MDDLNIPLKYQIIAFSIFMIVAIIVIGYQQKDTFFKIGSSNKKIEYKSVKGIVEFSSTSNFILIIDKDEKVSNLIFLDELSAKTLGQKDIENLNISDAINKIITLLNISSLDTNIILINYEGTFLEEIYENVEKNLITLKKDIKVTYKNATLEERFKELSLTYSNNKEDDLKQLYYYSQNYLLSTNTLEDDEEPSKDDDDLTYAKEIYNEIVVYANGKRRGFPNAIKNSKKNDPKNISIEDFDNSKVYDISNSSWYYIKDNKVYLYVKFISGSEYCFKGSIDNYSSGSC